MKFVDHVKNIGSSFGLRSKSRSLNQTWSPSMLLEAMSSNDPTMGYRNKIVFSVVNLLVNKLTETPLIVANVKDKGKANKYLKSAAVDGTRLHINKVLGFKEVEDHELNAILEIPNNYQTRIEFEMAYWFNRILFGRSFIYVEKYSRGHRNAGKPRSLHVLPSQMVEVIVNKGNFTDPIEGYRFTYDGKQYIYPKDSIMYDMSWSPSSHFESYNPWDTIGRNVKKNNVNEQAQEAAFRNGGTGILFSSDLLADGVGNITDKMTGEQMMMLKNAIQRDYAGASNNKRMHFTNGFVNVQSFGDTLADLELLKAHDKDVEAICGFYGVNPVLLYFMASGSTEANVNAAYKALVTNNVVPKLRKFDELFTRFSKEWYNEEIKVYHDITEFSELLPDYAKVKEIYGGNPAISLDEYRVLIGFTALGTPEMQKHYITTGFIPLEDAGIGAGYDPSGILNRPI